jgi:hypothetical protein
VRYHTGLNMPFSGSRVNAGRCSRTLIRPSGPRLSPLSRETRSDP